MSPDVTPLALTQHAISLWNEVAVAYDAIERRLGLGAWESFEEVASHIEALECELRPLLVTIAAVRADGTTPAPALTELWHELDLMVEALARRQKQLQRAATAARDTTAARLVRTRIARSRAAGYTPLNLLSPRFTSRRV
jgi:acyl-CoA synthetase (NDP forming)